MNKLIIAKTLRTSFNKTQAELLTATYYTDEELLQEVKQMQEVYNEFMNIVVDLRENDTASYEKLLGL